MPPIPSDEDPQDLTRTTWLATRLRKGDTERFQELYERVAPALFAWSRLRIQPPLRSRLDEQDLAQEIWFRASSSFESYSPSSGSFRAWIFGIAKKTLLEALRTSSAVKLGKSGG